VPGVAAQVTRRVSLVLFEGFRLLDAIGPLEVLDMVDGGFDVTLVGPAAGPVNSSQGTCVVADVSYRDAQPADIVIVPGGAGTRTLVHDAAWLKWLHTWAAPAPLVTSVCTGAALLAAAGMLEGYRATSNVRAFDWVRQFGEHVTWVEEVRWVEDRDRWTSAGVSAGIDMTLALAEALHGVETAREAAARLEYDWNGR
jgi:transcriptional regulator GlxA family with amidase domain